MQNKQITTKNTKRKVISGILFFVCICIFLFSAYQVYTILREYHLAEKYYATVQEYSPFNSELPATTTEKSRYLAIDTKELKKTNADFIGWIYADDTKINYPVVKGKDNSFYLTRDFNKNYLQNGSIFMDYRCDSNFQNHNTIIYGHNMRDGSMFGELDKYRNYSFFEKHKEMMYVNHKGVLKTLQIYSAHIVKSDSYVYEYQFVDDEKFGKFIEKTVSSSLYDTGIKPAVSDKIVTLSTCSYEYDEARLVVHAILK